MTTEGMIRAIYDSEINWKCESFWDGGYTFRVGDDVNGWGAEYVTKDFGNGVRWICDLSAFKKIAPDVEG